MSRATRACRALPCGSVDSASLARWRDRMYIQHDAGDATRGAIYTIFGTTDDPMMVPPGYQEAAPFGAHMGGVDPRVFPWMASAAADSWLTVSREDGNADSALGAAGINFELWTDEVGMTLDNAAVFLFDPATAPAPVNSKTLVAQLTVATGSRFLLSTSCQGRATEAGAADWAVTGIHFTVGSAWVGNCWAEQYTHCGVPCQVGTADSDADGTTPCERCVAGTYAGENATACVPCTSGMHDDDSDPATACIPCPAGSTSAAGETQCTPRRCTGGLSVDNSPSICAGVVGDECSFRCAEGYVAAGTHICAEDVEMGSVSFAGGSCEIVSCVGSPPGDGATGCDAGPYTFGDSCDYSCPDGSRPEGLHTCGADGTMSGGACVALTAACDAADAALCPERSSCDLANGSPVCICDPGNYRSEIAGGGGVISCQQVTACAVGSEYEAAAPTEASDRVCAAVTACDIGQATTSPATLTRDTMCAACAPGTFVSRAGVCDPCPDGTFDTDGDASTACEATEEAVATALFATIGGAISEAQFITAAAAAAGDRFSAENIQVASFVQTVAASASVPGALDDYTDLINGAAARQFRTGVASAAGVAVSAVAITEVGGRRRRMQVEVHTAGNAGARRRVQADQTVTVQYQVASHEDISGTVMSSSWSANLATSINDAGDAIAPVQADMFSDVAATNIQTAVTFTTSIADVTAAQIDTGALLEQVARVSPEATLSIQPTVILAATLPVSCEPGNELSVDRTGCVACPAGQADLDGVGATPCDSCPIGTQALGGGRSCTPCPDSYADHDADPATACEKPHVVATSVLLDGTADRATVRSALSAASQIHLENVEFVAWVESIQGSVVLRAPGLATARPDNFAASFISSFATSLDLPRSEITEVSVESGCEVIMSDAGQTDSDDCVTVAFAVEADHEVAVSGLLTTDFPATLALDLRSTTGIDTIGAWGTDTTTISVSSLRTSVEFVVLCPSTTEADLVTARLSELSSLPWGVGVTVVESQAAEIITDESGNLRPPPPPPRTCEGFDCARSENALDADPASIVCTNDPCSSLECCTVEPDVVPRPTPPPTETTTPPPPPASPSPTPPPVQASSGAVHARPSAMVLRVMTSALCYLGLAVVAWH